MEVLGTVGPASYQMGSWPPKLLYHLPAIAFLTLLLFPAYNGIHTLEKSITSDWHCPDLGNLNSGLGKPSQGTQKPYHTCVILAVSPSCTRGHRERCSCFTKEWVGMGTGCTWAGNVVRHGKRSDRKPFSVVMATAIAKIPLKVYREPAHLPALTGKVRLVGVCQ